MGVCVSCPSSARFGAREVRGHAVVKVPLRIIASVDESIPVETERSAGYSRGRSESHFQFRGLVPSTVPSTYQAEATGSIKT